MVFFSINAFLFDLFFFFFFFFFNFFFFFFFFFSGFALSHC
jgi:hypothetical protein